MCQKQSKTSITNQPSMYPPHRQEVFEATPWVIGNTGRTQKHDYNDDFEMKYRFVDTSKKLFNKKGRVKKSKNVTNLQGVRSQPMGSPQVTIDPDPKGDVNVFPDNDFSVFESLDSVQAARLNTDRLNIAYDCEYRRIAVSEYRLITSYQFAVYLPDAKTVLEVIFQSLINDVMNRLYLRTCIGAILDLLDELNAIDVISASYAITRRWNINESIPYFEGADDTYINKRTFKSIQEAKEYQTGNSNSLVVLDKKAYRSNDYSEFRKPGVALDLAIICHAGIVDLPAFKDDIFAFSKKKGNIMPYLNSMQGGLTSTFPYFINVPTAKAYWKFYPVNIIFRDTMCCAPADGKALSKLGECVQVPKIILPEGVITRMDEYMREHPEDYMAYAAQDALVTLMYGSRLWGVNKDWPLTSTSGACFAMKSSIAKYMNIPCVKGKIDKVLFNKNIEVI